MSLKLKRKLSAAVSTAILGTFFCCAPATAQNTNGVRHLLRFRNGDVLLGKLQSIGPEKKLLWSRSDVTQPIEFAGTNLFEITFPVSNKRTAPATNACRVHFSNGDVIEGKLIQLDLEKVTLDTGLSAEMILPRKMIRSLELLPGEAQTIFSGPAGLEGWTIGKVTAPALGESGQWRYTNGAFYATRSASIARDVKLPDVAQITFDLAWKNSMHAAVALYTSYMHPVSLPPKEDGPEFGGFYSLQLNSFVATLMPVKQKEQPIYLGQVPFPALKRKDTVHVDIFVNKPRASIILFLDGILVREWIDPVGFAGTGTGMRFVHQGQGAIRLSNFRVLEWSGKLNQPPSEAPALKEDLAHLLNGDKVSGALEWIRDGKLSFATGSRKLEIPVGRVSEIQMREPPADNTTNLTSLVRAFFVDGNDVTFRLESWDDKGVVGSSPNFGRVIFATNAFERVELYPSAKIKAVLPKVQ